MKTVRMTKKNKEKWIFGKGARSSRQIHYPPVTPWITHELRDDIIELFMAGMTGQEDKIAGQLRDLTRQQAQLEALTFLSPVQKRQLAKVEKELNNLLARKQGESRQRNAAAKEAMMLHLMRGIRGVEVLSSCPGPLATPVLRLITSPIAINGVILGTYDVYFQPKGRTPKDALFLRRRDYLTGQGPHPHWSSYGCFGSYGPVFQNLLKRYQYGTLLGAFLQYLAIYDAGSPLIRLSEFNEGTWKNEDPMA